MPPRLQKRARNTATDDDNDNDADDAIAESRQDDNLDDEEREYNEKRRKQQTDAHELLEQKQDAEKEPKKKPGRKPGSGTKKVKNGTLGDYVSDVEFKIDQLWLDASRPREFSELTFHDDINRRLQNLVATREARNSLPHLLFYGPSGGGKRTRVQCLLNELFRLTPKEEESLMRQQEQQQQQQRQRREETAEEIGEKDKNDDNGGGRKERKVRLSDGTVSAIELLTIPRRFILKTSNSSSSNSFGGGGGGGVGTASSTSAGGGNEIFVLRSPFHMELTPSDLFVDSNVIQQTLKAFVQTSSQSLHHFVRETKQRTPEELKAEKEREMQETQKKQSDAARSRVAQMFAAASAKKIAVQATAEKTTKKDQSDAKNDAKNVKEEIKFENPSYRVVIINHADRLSQKAQAALRRTIEAYTDHVRFILIAERVEGVIDPIQSRCMPFRIPLVACFDANRTERRVPATAVAASTTATGAAAAAEKAATAPAVATGAAAAAARAEKAATPPAVATRVAAAAAARAGATEESMFERTLRLALGQHTELGKNQQRVREFVANIARKSGGDMTRAMLLMQCSVTNLPDYKTVQSINAEKDVLEPDWIDTVRQIVAAITIDNVTATHMSGARALMRDLQTHSIPPRLIISTLVAMLVERYVSSPLSCASSPATPRTAESSGIGNNSNTNAGCVRSSVNGVNSLASSSSDAVSIASAASVANPHGPKELTTALLSDLVWIAAEYERRCVMSNFYVVHLDTMLAQFLLTIALHQRGRRQLLDCATSCARARAFASIEPASRRMLHTHRASRIRPFSNDREREKDVAGASSVQSNSASSAGQMSEKISSLSEIWDDIFADNNDGNNTASPHISHKYVDKSVDLSDLRALMVDE